MGIVYLVVSVSDVEARIVAMCAFGIAVVSTHYFPAVAARHFQMVSFAGSEILIIFSLKLQIAHKSIKFKDGK